MKVYHQWRILIILFFSKRIALLLPRLLISAHVVVYALHVKFSLGRHLRRLCIGIHFLLQCLGINNQRTRRLIVLDYRV